MITELKQIVAIKRKLAMLFKKVEKTLNQASDLQYTLDVITKMTKVKVAKKKGKKGKRIKKIETE